MSNTVIKVENLSKQYRLGEIGTGSITHDVNRWWSRVRGKEDPYLKIGDVNDRTVKGDSEYVWALKDINFEVKQGEVLGVIGRNGAGKSTLLKILSRTTTPTIGSVKIKGRIASLLEVGTGFHPDLSGRDNIFLNGAILGMTKQEIKNKFDEIVDFAGIERYIDTPVKRYSSGMYVRLAFGVAAHLESEILIIDEVLAVGDAEFQKKALGKMQDASTQEGRTVLFVSHNMAALSTLCTTSILMQYGQIVAQGNTRQIIDKYISAGIHSEGEILQDEIIYKEKSSKAFFNSIRVICNNKITNLVGIGDEVIIELEYTIVVQDTILNCSIHLLDNFGACIFATTNLASANLLVDDYSGKSLQMGRYKSHCKIPANFLNDANYVINAFLVPKDNHDMASVENALTLSVTETGEMRKEYTGQWIGMLRPKFAWNTIFVG
ncbi:MAG TPA: ABC transporter ATP-binding protein [Ferruginibacter sp.]|nr:ABC transporter ATP-binding protein [Ferruginibacter sp.]